MNERLLVKPLTITIKWTTAVFLIVIAIATAIAGIQEIISMVNKSYVDLADLLLLFIYLEVLAMVSIYMSSGALPIRMPMYIAIVALARHLILDMKTITELEIISTATAILIVSLAVLAIRYGHIRFPYEQPREKAAKQSEP